MNLLKIKKISEEKGITLTLIAEKIDMSVQNLHKCIKGNRIEAGDLEKIAEVIGVSVTYFFDENMSVSTSTPKQKNASCSGCKDKEKIIRLLEDKIDLLDKLEKYEGKVAKRAI
jgi:transcriptional regulator with XRE-family HTH domain